MITTLAFILLIIAAIIQIIFLIKKQTAYDPISLFIFIGVAILLCINFIDRSIKIQFAAITNTFESLIFYCMNLMIVIILFRVLVKNKIYPLIIFGSTIVAIALLAIASSPIAPREVLPPVPALQSTWLSLHVSLSFIGEAFFAVGFITAIYYLLVKDEEKKKNIYRLMYTFNAIGYPIFTAGALIFGAIWAQYAWGSYWSWDPKETWALITWLVYTAYLHTRLVPKIDKKVAALLSIIGFSFTVFTFFGVNYLLRGMHSYL
ncbi:MAG: cytochrome c biogenesis protein CcsA [Spirochaetales bacterium]|nr:cytochrome c biogenesis protein CcsA [Spirochaetales bacterium]